MPINAETIISVQHVSFRYNGRPVLVDITLEIQRGEFVGMIGPNGSGKTTLLKIMLGLLTPKTGAVELFGTDIGRFTDWSKIGYVPQKAGSVVTKFPITVSEVVGMGGTTPKAITDALTAVDMLNFRNTLLNELSGGQVQRVFIARSLASNPELLFLDEPTVGVDIESQTKFYELLRKLNKERKLTLVLVSHDLDIVAHEVGTLACINGNLMCHGRPKDIMKGDFIEQMYGKEVGFIIHNHGEHHHEHP